MSIGALMLDLEGTELTPEECELLQHPLVGGVIFFSRNYESIRQISDLVKQVRLHANSEVLIAVDHEGGRVQRFRDSFTQLPAIGDLGVEYDQDSQAAKQRAERLGWLMAAELRAVDIDFSFAPVLDLNYGVSEIIGDRSFHRQPQAVIDLATAYIKGMKQAGMASTGKHFPGHGYVVADSHVDVPVDERSLTEILKEDAETFKQLFVQGLDAVMPAHVIYNKVDELPAGFSTLWLQDILRQQMNFDGVIFSDDLKMEGATVVGSFTERAEAAVHAGCDMILVCNDRTGAIEVVDNLKMYPDERSAQRLQRMRGQPFMNRSALLETELWQQATQATTAVA